MKHAFPAAAALLAGTAAAHAGGIERSTQSVLFMFEQGGYAEFSLNHVSPDVSGTATPGFGGSDSGDMSGGYTSVSLAFKMDMTDRLSLGFAYEQPYGADVDYPAGTGYPLGGARATVDTDELKMILKYKIDDQWSVYGGIRFQQASGEVVLPIPSQPTYTMTTSDESNLGYLVGVAYEKPEIALRVALTYHSAVTHEFTATENYAGGVPTSFETTNPQSLTLDVQSGIAKDTLLFGSIRWVDWSEFDITPAAFNGATGTSLVEYDSDTTTYTLGIARRFTDSFAGIASVSYEGANGGYSANLGPTDGRTSVSLAGRYDVGNVTLTGGVSYIWIGDAETQLGGATLGEFEDNHAWGAGLRIGYHF